MMIWRLFDAHDILGVEHSFDIVSFKNSGD